MADEAKHILKKYWGHENFRPNQERIINSVLAGFDTLALLPTGGGKSVCFQVPAMLLPGITLVVSPLVALMQDQVERLREQDIKAEMIVSGMAHQEVDRLLDNCVYGDVKLLYVSPERLKSEVFLERWKKMKAALIAVDEAHCISQWGYDFRPPYLEIAQIRLHHPDIPVIALTATATEPVVKDIQQRLGFPKDNVFQSSFGRDNLGYQVVKTESKLEKVDEILRKLGGSTIIYAGTRKGVANWTRYLQARGHSTGSYHAGLDVATKDRMRSEWMQNKLRVMVATNAFGMGIDKPDVRLVMHVHLPPNLEAYFQEAGRAGRDGNKSHAILIWDDQDTARLEEFTKAKYPAIEDVKRVYSALGALLNLAVGAGLDTSHAIDIKDFSHRFGFTSSLSHHSFKLLESAGFIHLNENGITTSRVLILVGKEALYKYQVAHKDCDQVLKLMLRSSAGLFERHQAISENRLASLLGKQPGDVRALLKKMHQEEIIDYQSKMLGTILTYTNERLQDSNISLPAAVYQNRKKIDFLRVNAVRRYVTRLECRSQQLLSYFGETESDYCGKCDVCRKSSELKLKPEIMHSLSDAIREALGSESMSMTTLLDILKGFDPKRIKILVRLKIDTGEILRTSNDEISLHP